MKHPRLVAGFAMMTFVLGACTVTKENQNVCKGTWAVLGAAVGRHTPLRGEIFESIRRMEYLGLSN